MYICVKCKIEMVCRKNGVDVVYGTSHVYASDVYECPECGAQIAATVDVPRHDPKILERGYDLIQMDE